MTGNNEKAKAIEILLRLKDPLRPEVKQRLRRELAGLLQSAEPDIIEVTMANALLEASNAVAETNAGEDYTALAKAEADYLFAHPPKLPADFTATDPAESETLDKSAGKPEPNAIIWRPDREGAVLSAGEVLALTGVAGLGKSWLAGGLAIAAAKGGGAHCGLEIARGPVYLFPYEDRPVRLAARYRRMGATDENLKEITINKARLPLFLADRAESRRCRGWDAIWRQVRSVEPKLVIIDPTGRALSGAGVAESAPVNAFISALEAEAEIGGWGVLLVTHPNKAASSTKNSDNPMNMIAGSGAWINSVRGILTLEAAPNNLDEDRVLSLAKNNYGATWTGNDAISLTKRTTDKGEYAGLQKAAEAAGKSPFPINLDEV